MNNFGAGFQITLDLYDCECDISLLKDYNLIKEKLFSIIKASSLTPVADTFYSFNIDKENQCGYSGAIILQESHVTIHTWPEEKIVNTDIYVCNYLTDNRNKVYYIVEELKKIFNAKKINTNEINRYYDEYDELEDK